MRFRLLVGLLLLVVIAGCQGPPPTLVYIIITATPEGTEAAANQTVSPDVTQTSVTAEVIAAPSLTPSPTETPLPQATATSSLPPTNTLVPSPAPTDLPPNFPTAVRAPIQVAEELFEHGRMFWVGATEQIWVLKITGEGRGTWEVYEDTFVDGEPENDPNLVPPEGRYQPQRGFGKLWRESGNLREELGWGVTPEFGYVSNYEYHAGGSVDANGNYVPGPGYHILYSLGGELFRFNEADGTWQLGNS